MNYWQAIKLIGKPLTSNDKIDRNLTIIEGNIYGIIVLTIIRMILILIKS